MCYLTERVKIIRFISKQTKNKNMKTLILKVTAVIFAAASLGTLAFAGSTQKTTATCSDCAACCASDMPCPVGSCCE